MTYLPDPSTLSSLGDQRRNGPLRYVAPGWLTRGDYGLFEMTLGPTTPGAGPHLHRTFSESFYVLDGELEVLADDHWVTAGTGELVYVPRSGVHGFRNAADRSARFFILFTPGVPREEYFDGLVALRAGGRRPTDEELDDLARRHDQLNLRDHPVPGR